MPAEFKTVVRDAGGVATAGATTILTMSGWKMVLVRCARVYLQSLLGFLMADSTGLAAAVGIPLDKFGGALWVAATLAVAPATISLVQNIIEILTNIDVNSPALRA